MRAAASQVLHVLKTLIKIVRSAREQECEQLERCKLFMLQVNMNLFIDFLCLDKDVLFFVPLAVSLARVLKSGTSTGQWGAPAQILKAMERRKIPGRQSLTAKQRRDGTRSTLLDQISEFFSPGTIYTCTNTPSHGKEENTGAHPCGRPHY